jgi:signal transduction histidine kinase
MLTATRSRVINSQVVFRIYAAVAIVAGAVIVGTGPAWIGTAALTRVLGAVLLASGCWAITLSQLADPALRRVGLMWFAVAHYAVLIVADTQRIAMWGPDLAPSVQRITAGAFYVILSVSSGLFIIVLTIVTRRYFSDKIVVQDRPLRSRYEQQIRLAGAQEERNRLARDLHDSVKQQIFVIQTAAATAQTRFNGDRSGAETALDQIRSSAREAMTEMEAMMDQLRFVPLENASLVEALKKQYEALGHRTGAQVEFRLGDLPPNEKLFPGSQQAIFRVAQEALANIGRHTRAKNVTVSLSSLMNRLELRIQDDGAGFDQLQISRGMGITNMRARAEEFGGHFSLTSSPGHGTTVVLSIPHAPIVTSLDRKLARIYAATFGIAIVIAIVTRPRDTWVLLAVGLLFLIIRYAVVWYRTRQLPKETA